MPEKIEGTNMWRILEKEYILGMDGDQEVLIEGPNIVRVSEWSDLGLLSVQFANHLLEFETTDFSSIVRKKKG